MISLVAFTRRAVAAGFAVPAGIRARALIRSSVADSCGEAGSATGPTTANVSIVDGGRPGSGGPVPVCTSTARSSSPRFPVHDHLLNWRPAPENRDWLNVFALAGAVDQWRQLIGGTDA